MGKKLLFTVLLAGVLYVVSGTVSAAPPTGYWPFDGNLSDIAGTAGGTFVGGQPSYQRGQIGQAISFDGVDDYVDIPSPTNPALYTISVWVKPARTSAAGIVTRTDASGPVTSWSHQLRIGPTGCFHHYLWVGAERNVPGTTVIVPNTWYHVAIVAQNNGPMRLYVNGKEDGASVDTAGTLWGTGTRIVVGSNSGHAMGWFQGLVDDLRIYDQILTAAEIQKSMKSLSAAVNVSPEDGATDVTRDATLNWTAGQYPATHDVYLGTVAADVNNASRTSANGLLASQGQADTTFDPAGSLAYGQTYYWRVDEVNTSADGTVYKGNVWSFTAEPYGYPITGVTATASSTAPNMGPEKTIDGSGLTGDLHGTEGTAMWLTAGAAPNWIQYEFDKVYKLYDLKVWNSNQMIEGFLGFGAKKVTIEYSADGTTWTALDNVPEFGKATGMPGYAANTTVNLGGVMAQFVKLTINANWGGVAPQTGLSEVRFSYVPVQARAPQPATAATGVAIDPSLNWRPGREAGSHQVFFGADPNAVANGTVAAKTVTDHAFAPGSLNFGTAYYWKVDEVNTVTYPGDVWSFTTQEYGAIDDFESYNDDDNRIYDAWIDGYTDGKSGSIVGNMQAPFAEQTIIHGGKQSMPFEYNNVKTPYYSEASRTFEATQDWTINGADTVSLYFRGRPVAFADNGNNAFTISASGNDIWNNADQFRFAYKQLSGNGSITARVDSIGNTNVWAKAAVMIRETLDAGSKNACIAVTPGSGVSFQWRDTVNGASANSGTAALVAPYWVRITRTGNVFKAEYSVDGKTWIQQGVDTTVAMATSVYIGLAVTSHDAALTTTAEISNVSATGTITGSWQALAIGATMVTNGSTALYLTVEDKAGKTKTVVNPNPSASATGAWTQWQIPLSDLTGVNAAAVKKITLGVGDKASPKADATGMLYFDDIGYGHPAQ